LPHALGANICGRDHVGGLCSGADYACVARHWVVSAGRRAAAIYWVAGAAIAFTGAAGARIVAEGFPLRIGADRLAGWRSSSRPLHLSLGTRSHLIIKTMTGCRGHCMPQRDSSSTEHTCRSILTPQPIVLQRIDPVKKAVSLFLDHRMLGIPVVDPSGRYVGMFVRSTLIAMLLPRVLSTEEHTPEIGHLIDVGFISDTLEDARERFARVARRSSGTCKRIRPSCGPTRR
jgi:hypothetical protein